MKEKRMLKMLGNINEKYIDEADPQNRNVSKFRVNLIAVAACLGLVVLAGLCGSFYM